MKPIIIAIATTISITLGISCTRTIYIPSEQRHTEIVTLKDTVIERFSAGESHSNHTNDTTSILQGNGASSTASISNGILSHTLTIHPRHDSIALQVREVHIIDSVAYAQPPIEKHTHTAPTAGLAIVIASISLLLTIIFICKHLHRDQTP
ncbi:MAG: hypothetical protein IKJ79_04720 [Bacteroidaceae bacterium]|nr:hypothetical protein [Bacteroidaceae bacterium]MBR4069697.1 hypothetical protein [Bacteroidaceae bacterium]